MKLEDKAMYEDGRPATWKETIMIFSIMVVSLIPSIIGITYLVEWCKR